PAREDREIWSIKMGRCADRRQDVGGEREMQHLLLGDVDDGLLPHVDARELFGCDALADVALQGELSVQVLAEQAVLELARLSEQIDKLFPAVDKKWWFDGLRFQLSLRIFGPQYPTAKADDALPVDQVERANATSLTPVVFVHGLWLLPSSWNRWTTVFEGAGYTALTPGWPDDPETVEDAKAHPEVFARKSVGHVADHHAEVIGRLKKKPDVIGHSFG